jgi:hypothetical protein
LPPVRWRGAAARNDDLAYASPLLAVAALAATLATAGLSTLSRRTVSLTGVRPLPLAAALLWILMLGARMLTATRLLTTLRFVSLWIA